MLVECDVWAYFEKGIVIMLRRSLDFEVVGKRGRG